MPEHLVLVVDDEEAQRKVLMGFLRKRGYEVEGAPNVDEALRIATARPVDLVLTDLRMPGRTGLELLEELRKVNPEIPAIVMTAFGSVETAVEAIRRALLGPSRSSSPSELCAHKD